MVMVKSSSVVIAVIAISAPLFILFLLAWLRPVNYANIVALSPQVGMSGSGNITTPPCEEEEEELMVSKTIGEEAYSSRTDVGEDATTSAHPPVSFVPFPHNTLGSGIDMKCEWETRNLLAGDDSDSTQRAAFAEGICVPPRLNASIHVFSSAEAKECLRSRRMIISGDSFMKQQFIGLTDILLSKKLNGDKEPSTRSTRARSWHR